MKNTKFKINNTAYILQYYDFEPINILYKINIKLIEIRIINIDNKGIHGFHFENYGHIMKCYPHMESSIYTKKNKRKGKEIPWKESDTVALVKTYNHNQLLTIEEAKLQMITYIANDFHTDDEVCIGCTHGQDESY
jgi:hypothetical protein